MQDSKKPQLSIPKKSAAGLPAVISSLRHIQHETGLIRGMESLARMNQKGGFDCPGCAWPDPDDRSALGEYCENGAKALAEEATLRRVTPEFFKTWSIEDLSNQSDFWLGKQGRLTHPMWRKPRASHYEPISWEDAFALIAKELNDLNSPHEAVFYTSGRTSNEAAFLYQLLVRLYGTNNLPDCSNMCHESSGVALMETLGVGKGSVTLEDFDKADCILVIGQNPGTNHPRMLTALQKAVRNGCQIITINPLNEAGMQRFQNPKEISGILGLGTPLTSLFLQIRLNADVALLKGIMKAMLDLEELKASGNWDHAFIQKYTVGYEAWKKDLEAAPWDLILEESGITREEIQKAAEMILNSKRVICCWAMGLTQHRNAVDSIQEAVNLLLVGGHLGRDGAGVCPVRGHSNVQGDRTMGIWEKMPDEFLDRLSKEFSFSSPREHGMDTVESIQAMYEGRARVFIGMGGNFLSATPDTHYTAKALQRCRLSVQISTKLNRSHVVTGEQALILPCLGRTEKDLQAGGFQIVTVENSMGMIQRSEGHLKPGSPFLKSEVAIVAGLGQSLFNGRSKKVDWNALMGNYDRIRDSISRVIPGFSPFNERIHSDNEFYLPHPVRDQRRFNTSSGKARFTVHPIPKTELTSGQYLMMTIRSHDQYNTTIYGMEDRYRGIKGHRRVILMNLEDITDAQFSPGSLVDITSHFQGETRQAKEFVIVPYSIPRKCVATYFPETNVLVPIGSTAEKSNTPTYKSIRVSLARSALFSVPYSSEGSPE